MHKLRALVFLGVVSLGCVNLEQDALCTKAPDDPRCARDAEVVETAIDSSTGIDSSEAPDGDGDATVSDGDDSFVVPDATSAETTDATVIDALDTALDSEIPDTAVPESGALDTSKPDTLVDTGALDTAVPDSTLPDTAMPDTAMPDTAMPDTAMPDTAMPDTNVCTPSVTYCSGSELRKCAADGKSSTLTINCPSAATCDASLGRCTACTPGSFGCAAAARQQCRTLGDGFDTLATCATPELCAASSGATCTAPACGAGEKKCTGKVASTCNAGRTAFVDETCAVMCSAGACLRVTQLVSGGAHSCTLMSDATVRCWGNDTEGATGDAPLPHNRPVAPSGLAGTVRIAAGLSSSAAIVAGGVVKGWGYVGGTGSKTPTAIKDLASGMTDVAVGQTSCAMTAAGAISCWPAISGTSFTFPVTTVPSPPIQMATGGLNGTVFMLTTSGVYAWGDNGDGQFGDGTCCSGRTPAFPKLTYIGATSVAVGGYHTCGKFGTELRCSGRNADGQLGTGTGTADVLTPTVVYMLAAEATQFALSPTHTCARLVTGAVQCWGRGSHGQLGNGSTMDLPLPTGTVAGITNAVAVSCGDIFSCALLADGSVRCWGSNGAGTIGDGTTAPERFVPTSPLW